MRPLRSPQARSAGGGTAGRREGPRRLRLIAAAGLSVVLLPLTACGGNPPQIVDYAPQRGAVDVSTAAPIRITFDHAVDQASVESRLHVVPATSGHVRWLSPAELVYDHATLQTNTSYEVILDSGYRDPSGNTYTLRHHWSFVTERPPSLSGSTPANAEIGFDPSSFVTLDFTREMDPTSLAGAITIWPAVPFTVRLDPSDGRRAILALSELMTSQTSYQIEISVAAVDVDGNQLDRDQTISFSTGPARPLHHWITFATNGPDGRPAGLWIVNEAGIPRQLFSQSPVHSFSWSPDGSRLLVEGDGETWWELTPGGGAVELTFAGQWAAALSATEGYVYIDDSENLHHVSVLGADIVIAAGVTQAAVAPGGWQLAYVLGGADPDRIWGYDADLNARYELATDTGPVSNPTWAPSGERIAYLRADGATTTLRVRNLTGPVPYVTVATGEPGQPAWFPDSIHIVYAAGNQNGLAPTDKAYVANVAAPGLAPASGLPNDPAIDVASPVPSPDGHQIAFLNGDQVWLMNADGTHPTALTSQDPELFPYSCRTPVWTIS